MTQESADAGRVPLPLCGPRRLPVYILFGASDSLIGDRAMAAASLAEAVVDWAHAHSTREHPIKVVVIAYGTMARKAPVKSGSRLTAAQFLELRPTGRGTPSLESALVKLANSLAADLVRWGRPDGDSQPVVVLLTSGIEKQTPAEPEYEFERLLDVLKHCATVVALFRAPEEGNSSLPDRFYFADEYGPDEQDRLLVRLERELQRFHQEQQRPIGLSSTDAPDPGTKTHGGGSSPEHVQRPGFRLPQGVLRGLAAVVSLVLILRITYVVVSDRLIAWPGSLDYGVIRFGADGTAAATNWVTLWRPVGTTHATVNLVTHSHFDGKPIPPYTNTVVLSGRVVRVALPIRVVKLRANVSHSITGHVAVECSRADWKITPGEIPFRASLHPSK
ncbi:hypothetical protein ACFLSJ_06745 [Verrucomicrobiota bacterium]